MEQDVSATPWWLTQVDKIPNNQPRAYLGTDTTHPLPGSKLHPCGAMISTQGIPSFSHIISVSPNVIKNWCPFYQYFISLQKKGNSAPWRESSSEAGEGLTLPPAPDQPQDHQPSVTCRIRELLVPWYLTELKGAVSDPTSEKGFTTVLNPDYILTSPRVL